MSSLTISQWQCPLNLLSERSEMKRILIMVLVFAICLFSSCDIELSQGGSLLDEVENDILTTVQGMTPGNPYSVKSGNELLDLVSQADVGEFYVRLDDDIRLQNDPACEDYGVLVLSGERIMHLDLNGHRISERDGDIARTAKDSNGVSQILINVLDGATLEISNSSAETAHLGGEYDDNPSSGIITVTDGNLIVGGDIVIQMFSISQGAAIFAEGNSNVTLNPGIQIYASKFTLNASTSTGKTIINGGTYASIATNRFYNGAHFAYTILVSSDFEINDCIVYGGQGGIAATGNGVINGGSMTSTVRILDYVPEAYRRMYSEYHVENKEHDRNLVYQVTDGEIWNALYCAGEFSESPAIVINGGTFRTDGKTYAKAIAVGNSNDGGAGLSAVAVINGGVFDGPISADSRKPHYGHGVLELKGGKFNTSESEIRTYLAADYSIEGPDADGYCTVVAAE